MEQQKMMINLQEGNKQNIKSTDKYGFESKSQRSLHQISHSNIKSKAKLIADGQCVISYNFDQRVSSQFRTHNLLIGADNPIQDNCKNFSQRKNVLGRINYTLSNHKKIKTTNNQSIDGIQKAKKLIQIRTNNILESNVASNGSNGIKSFYMNKRNNQQNQKQFNSQYDTKMRNINHQRIMQQKIQKIGTRKLQSKNLSQKNYKKLQHNSIVQSEELSQYANDHQYNRIKDHQYNKHNDHQYNGNNSSSFNRNNDNQYNNKLNKILGKVKKQSTKQSLKNAFSKKSPQKRRNKQNSFNQSFNQREFSQKLTNKVQFDSDYDYQQDNSASSNIRVVKGASKFSNATSVNNLNGYSQAFQQQVIRQKRKLHPLIKVPQNNYQLRNQHFQQFHRIESQNEDQQTTQQNMTQIADIQNAYQITHQDIDISKIQANQKSIKNQSNMNQNTKSNVNISKSKQNTNQNMYKIQGLNMKQLRLNVLNMKQLRLNGLNGKLQGLNGSNRKSQYLNDQNNKLEQMRGIEEQQSILKIRQKSKKSLKNIVTPNHTQRIHPNHCSMISSPISPSNLKSKQNYKDLLKLLSQENNKKRQLQEEDNRKKLMSINQRSSRFKDIDEQKAHIQRVLTPIGHSFLDQRRKKLSLERINKSKSGASDQNGASIIQRNSDHASSTNISKHKSKSPFNNKNLRNNNQHQNSKLVNNKNNNTNQYQNNKLVNNKKNNPNQHQSNKLVNNKNNTNQQKNEHRSSKVSEQNEKMILKNKSVVKKDVLKKKEQQKQIQQPTGIKIPSKAIQKASSQLYRNMHNKTATKVHDKKENMKPNPFQKVKKPLTKIDKRSSIPKQINIKDWKMKQKQQKQKKQQIQRQAKEKLIKEKQWRWAQKDGKSIRLTKVVKIDQNGNHVQQWVQAPQSTQQQQHQNITRQNQSRQSKLSKQSRQSRQSKNQQNSQMQEQQLSNIDLNENEQQIQMNSQQIDQAQYNQNQKAQNRTIKKKHNKQNKKRQSNNNSINGTQNQKQNNKNINTNKNKNSNDKQNVQKTTFSKQKAVNDYSNGQQKAMTNDEVINSLKQNVDSNNKRIQKLQGTQKQRNSKLVQTLNQKQTLNNDQKRNSNISKQPTIPVERQTSTNDLKQQRKQRVQEVQKPKQQIKITSINNFVENQKQNQKSSDVQRNIKNSSTVQNKMKRSSAEQNNMKKSTLAKNDKGPNNVNNKYRQENVKQQYQRQKVKSNQQQKAQKKNQFLQNLLQNKALQQQGIMQISESKFHIYNTQSQHSILMGQTLPIQQSNRALITNYLYNLPQNYQRQLNKFLPNQNGKRVLQTMMEGKVKQQIANLKLKQAVQHIHVYQRLLDDIKKVKEKRRNYHTSTSDNIHFTKQIFQPFTNLQGEIGVWLFCVGVWRLITVKKTDKCTSLYNYLQKAYIEACKTYYFSNAQNELSTQQILKMITGLRVSKFTKNKKNRLNLFKQIEYNIKKSHIIRALKKADIEQSKFDSETINCIRKIESTPNGQKVLQVVSYSIGLQNVKPRYFWIKQQKFLDYFESFIILSKRNKHSNWTNKLISVKDQQKSVFLIDSQSMQRSGSITIYPLSQPMVTNQKCTIAFYKQIQPQVLKLMGKAQQKLPQSLNISYTSKLNFQFNIKGTYYIFLELSNGQYNISVQSNSIDTHMEFVENVRKQTMRNQQCQYVQIDKVLNKKNQSKTNGFKQLMNFMKKKTNPFLQTN